MHLKGTGEKLEEIVRENFAHLVDFLRKLYIPSNPRNGGECVSRTAPSVTELHRAGVKFRVASSVNLFDIKFNNGILEITKLTRICETERILGNLIALDQCHCIDNYLNDYVTIMHRFVKTPADMDLLVRHGIVVNRIGDSGGGDTLINELVDVVTMTRDFYFADICEELNVFCRSFRYKLKALWLSWKKNLKENYFNTLWAVISVIAATFLLVLTIVQAVCSIISVKK